MVDTVADIQKLVEKLKGPTRKALILLGMPYYWRTLGNDTENSPLLHTRIKSVDVPEPICQLILPGAQPMGSSGTCLRITISGSPAKARNDFMAGAGMAPKSRSDRK